MNSSGEEFLKTKQQWNVVLQAGLFVEQEIIFHKLKASNML